jgi:hypothetical protein
MKVKLYTNTSVNEGEVSTVTDIVGQGMMLAMRISESGSILSSV